MLFISHWPSDIGGWEVSVSNWFKSKLCEQAMRWIIIHKNSCINIVTRFSYQFRQRFCNHWTISMATVLIIGFQASHYSNWKSGDSTKMPFYLNEASGNDESSSTMTTRKQNWNSKKKTWTHRRIHETKVPSSANAATFRLFWAILCTWETEQASWCVHISLAFSISCRSFNDPNSIPSIRLKMSLLQFLNNS